MRSKWKISPDEDVAGMASIFMELGFWKKKQKDFMLVFWRGKFWYIDWMRSSVGFDKFHVLPDGQLWILFDTYATYKMCSETCLLPKYTTWNGGKFHKLNWEMTAMFW